MSKKPVITQEQAEAIKEVERGCLVNMSVEELVKAMVIGYEVEPEYKENDWVLYESDVCQDVVTKIIDIQYGNNRAQFDTISGWKNIKDIERHATQEEIKQEKECRFWSKYDREVGEYRPGDLFINPIGELCEVIKFEPNPQDEHDHPIKFINKHGREDGFMEGAPLTIVCFNENRLDVSE